MYAVQAAVYDDGVCACDACGGLVKPDIVVRPPAARAAARLHRRSPAPAHVLMLGAELAAPRRAVLRRAALRTLRRAALCPPLAPPARPAAEAPTRAPCPGPDRGPHRRSQLSTRPLPFCPS
jgi:hypothetical protein